jgi:uncharacterized protein DUF4150/HNH/endonuclease VII toxin of polymorphic toxin system
MPDVCFTPPQTPATPPGVPIPYPNTGMASDSTDGSKTVQVSGQEVMLKDKSCFKKSTGDEAGSAPKKGLVTSKIQGKVYFNAWSMDVKFEGENVVRHLDLTTHNHGSVPGNSPTWPYLDDMAVSEDHPCHKDKEKEADACAKYDPHTPGGGSPCPPDGISTDANQVERYADKVESDECLRARRCALSPQDPKRCCPGQTPHHLVEASSFFDQGRGVIKSGPRKGEPSVAVRGTEGYKTTDAPCICVEGANQFHGTHGIMHIFQNTANTGQSGTVQLANGATLGGDVTTYGAARDQGVQAVGKAFPSSACNPKCLESQVNAYHRQCGIKDRTPIKSVTEGYDDAEVAQDVVRDRSRRAAQL